jgi:predicted dehydrogenase
VSLDMSLPAWFYDKKLSGGALVDQATHNLDLLRRFVGEVAQARGVASNPVHGKKKGYTVDEVLSVSLVFKNGAAGGHVHTWVGDKWRNELVLSGEKRLYRLDLAKGVLTVEQGRTTRTVTQDHGRMYEHQNKVFLGMVVSGDWTRNPCDYADGLKTLELTMLCDRAIS